MGNVSEVFRQTCRALEQRTAMSALEARGTVRLALRCGGLEAETVKPEEMSLVLTRFMPRELRMRGIAESEEICASIAEALEPEQPSPRLPEPTDLDDVFQRVFGH